MTEYKGDDGGEQGLLDWVTERAERKDYIELEEV